MRDERSMNSSDTVQPERRGMIRRWLWVTAAAAAATALVTMYVYEKSLEDDFETMLRAALQQFEAESGSVDRRAVDAPAPNESAERS
jgi:type VI protein secretion system component VasF